MNAAAAGMSMFDERIDPGKVTSIALAAAVHLLLFAILVFGVSWQNRPPESIAVEIWEEPPPPAPVVETPKPQPQVEPTPPVAVKPEPAKPEPVVPKPEIVEKKAPPPKPKPVLKEEPKPVPKAAPKPVPKAEPLKPRVDDTKRIREMLAREQNSIAIDRERQQMKDMLAKDAGAATAKAQTTWMGKIQSQIRGRINKDIADAVPGNPTSVFVVTLLPTYEVLNITLLKSGGNKAYDDEVERAILRASPLPKPDKAEVFVRELRLTFRPKDI